MFQTKLLWLAIFYAATPGPEAALGPVQVHLCSRAELTEQAYGRLRHEVEQIFSPAGILFDWRDPEEDALIHVSVEPRPRSKVILGCTRGLHDHRLGDARPASRHITLWTEQVARGTAGDWDSREPPSVKDSILGQALGRVLAHEMGHLFLQLHQHRPGGLMRSSFKCRDLSSRSRRAFTLSSSDIERIRESVRALFAEPSP